MGSGGEGKKKKPMIISETYSKVIEQFQDFFYHGGTSPTKSGGRYNLRFYKFASICIQLLFAWYVNLEFREEKKNAFFRQKCCVSIRILCNFRLFVSTRTCSCKLSGHFAGK